MWGLTPVGGGPLGGRPSPVKRDIHVPR